MTWPADTPVAFSDLERRVWVEPRPNGTETSVYWAAYEIAPDGFLGYNVYRSPEPCDDLASPSLEKLTASPEGVPFYIDDYSSIEPFGRPAYLVTEVDGTGERPIDRPVQVGDTEDDSRYGRRHPVLSMPRIYTEFRRRKEILLELNGENVTVLVRRLAGRRCPACFDGTYEAARSAGCAACYGTGWNRGYELVKGVRVRVTSIAEALKLQPEGLQFSSNPQGWHVGFPLLRQGDVIARVDGKRYQVQKISLTVHQGILTGQDYDLIAFEPRHPIYSVPL